MDDQPNFADELPNPRTLGQQAGQDAGVIPTAAPNPARNKWMAKAAAGMQQAQATANSAPPAAPAIANSDEPNFADDPNQSMANYANDRAGGGFSTELIDAQAADQKLNDAKKSAVATAAGGPVDTNTGLQDFSQRFRLGFIGNAADRAKYLSDKGFDSKVVTPEGGEPMVVFRKPGDPQWQTVRGTGPIGTGDIGGAVPSTLRAGGQVLTALATDGASLPEQVGAQGLAGFFEKLFEHGVNRTQGYNSQSIPADVGDSAVTGMTNAAGELAGQTVSKGLRMTKGEGAHLFNPTAEGQNVLDAAKRLQDYHSGTVGPTFGMVGGPLMAAKEQQFAAVSPYLKDAKYDPMARSLSDLLQKAVNDNTGGAAPMIGNNESQVGNILFPGLDKVLEGMRTDASAGVKSAIPEVTPSAGGKALQSGVEDLKGALADRKNAKYADQLEAAKGVGFDLSKPNSVADTIMQGIEAQGRPKQVTQDVPISNGINIGAPATKTVTSEEPTTVQIGGLSPQLQGVVNDLKKLNPQLFDSPNGTPAYKPLQSINSRLGYSAGHYPVDGTPEQKAAFAQAGQLQDALHESLNNPVGEGSAEFMNKTDAAKNSAKFMNRILDHPDMQTAMKSESPEDLIKLASPENFTFLQQAQRTIPPEKFADFKDAWKTGLVNNPDSIPEVFAQYAQKDPRVLNILASKDDQKLLTDYADSMKAIKGGVVSAMRAEPDMAARPGMALKNADALQIKDLVDRAGGPQSPVAQNLRAAVFQKLMKEGGDPATGMLDMNEVAKSAGSLMDSGAMDALLTPEELQRLADVRTYANSAAQVSGDTQSSMHKGSIASKFGNILHPIKAIKSLADIAEAGYQSRVWGSDAGRRFLIGEGKKAILPVRAGADAAASVLDSQRNQEPDAPDK